MSLVSRINGVVRRGGAFLSGIANSVAPGLSRPTTREPPPTGMPGPLARIKALSAVGRRPFAQPAAAPTREPGPQPVPRRGAGRPPRQSAGVLFRRLGDPRARAALPPGQAPCAERQLPERPR